MVADTLGERCGSRLKHRGKRSLNDPLPWLTTMKQLRFLLPFSIAMALISCDGSDGNDPTGPTGPEPFTYDAAWPADIEAVFTTSFSDPGGDQEALPVEMAGPPYSGPVPFPPVDVTEVQLGIEGDFLYMRVRYAGTIPTDVVHIAQAGEVEEQWVRNQGMNVAVNSDGAPSGGSGEGVAGIDIFFAVSFEYGVTSQIYANYDFPDGDVHHHQYQIVGELGLGGPGHDFAVARYDVSNLGPFLPRGIEVDVGSWSEAESFNADGSLKYHHFAFDRVIDGGRWPIPAL